MIPGPSDTAPRQREAPPVGRLAPSPTGWLHVGHARTFLLAWWSVRARGGRVLLRIEDLDRARSRPELVEACLRDLEWLGLDWDGSVLLQSADTAALHDAVQGLLRRGAAYVCTCSRKDIERTQSAPHADDGELRYPGTCRARRHAAEVAAGIRLRVPCGPIEIEDRVAGRVRFDVQADVGDFLLARRDGEFAYQLAVVVDDARMGVSEVLRGDDLLPSAARQRHLQRALGLPAPVWCHVPLVHDDVGRRLAKRSGDLALSALRAAGVDPRALVGWAARSAGQAVEARATAREVLPRFDLALLPRAPAVFGPRERAELEPGRLDSPTSPATLFRPDPG